MFNQINIFGLCGGIVAEPHTQEGQVRGLDRHSRHRVVSLSKTHLLPKSIGNTQEAKANITEKLFTGK